MFQSLLAKETQALEDHLEVSPFDLSVVADGEHLGEEFEAGSPIIAFSNCFFRGYLLLLLLYWGVFSMAFVFFDVFVSLLDMVTTIRWRRRRRVATPANAIEIELGLQVHPPHLPVVKIHHVGITRVQFLSLLYISGSIEPHIPTVESISNIWNTRVIKPRNDGVEAQSTHIRGKIGIRLDDPQQSLVIIGGVDLRHLRELIVQFPYSTASLVVQTDVISEEGLVVGAAGVDALLVKAGQ